MLSSLRQPFSMKKNLLRSDFTTAFLKLLAF